MNNILKYCFLILSILVFVDNGISQEEKKKVFESSRSSVPTSASKRKRSSLRTSESLISTDPNKALKIVEDVLLEAIENEDIFKQAEAYYQLGEINFQLEEYSLAKGNYKKSIDLYINLNNENGKYNALKKIGRATELSGELEESLKFYDEFLKAAKLKKAKSDILETKGYIAGVYKKMSKFEKSEEAYEEVLVEEERLDEKSVQIARKELGDLHEKKGDYDKAIFNYTESKDMARDLGDKEEVNSSFSKISDVYKKTNKLADVLETKEEALDYNLEINNEPEVAKNYIDIAEVYLEMGDDNEAEDNLKKSIVVSDKVGELESKGKALEHLYKIYDRSGNEREAYKNLKAYVAITDSIQDLKTSQIASKVEQKEILANVQNKLEIFEKDKEIGDKTIGLYNKGRQLEEAELQRQKLITYSLLAGIIILLITFLIVFRNVREKRKANQLLTLKSLRSQMNPHFIFNALNSVNNYISVNDERSANKYLSDFSKLMRQVMDNSQEEFIPLSSEIEILNLYLKLEHSRFKDKFEYEFKVDPDINIEAFKIPPMLIQPYIENAVWHGLRYKKEKGKLKVEFKKRGDGLMVIVEDDGIGRAQSKILKTQNQMKTKSLGMKNVDHRLKILNDVYNTSLKINIDDVNKEEGTGTRVVINLDENVLIEVE